MPDFYNGQIEAGIFTDPTDIVFIPNGVTALTLSDTGATFNVPLVGDGSGLTGVTAGSNPPQSYKIQNTATSTLLWCPTGANIASNPASSSLQAFYPWMSPFQLQEDLIINELSTEVIAGIAGLSFMMGIYELDNNFNCQTLIVGSSVLSGVTGGLKTYTIGSPITLDKNKWYGSVILGNVNFNHRACIAPNIIGGAPASAIIYGRFRMNYYAFPAAMPATLNIDIASGSIYAVSIWVK